MTLTPILRTKLYVPPVRAELTSRPRLLERLSAGLREHRKLTLVSAPAGYGKTTLAAEWLSEKAQSGKRRDGTDTVFNATWLSLDENDNNPEHFIAYWLAAWQRIDPALGQNVRNLLAMSPLPPLTLLIEELLNDLVGLVTPAVLVLDDYHVMTNPDLHDALVYFVEHQPPQIHLVITTREDPPLPLARLRARAQLTEIRARDLRFTQEEAQQFFRHSMQLNLDSGAIETLETRTEGWAAGLQLAALALQHFPNRKDFLADFGGSHRYVIDYLAEEVLRQQDEEIRNFLIQTAVLDRLCGALCDALLGKSMIGELQDENRSPSTSVLYDLEKANLFLIPLDGERRWYRYHHLFADYLRAELPDAERTTLYKRAAIWHEANGLIEEAVHYALISGDSEFSADVIARALKQEATWSSGNLAQWRSWLEALPSQVFRSRPQLSLNASRIQYLSGRFELAETHLTLTEQTLASQSAIPEAEHKELRALAALYRGAIAAVHGDSEQAIARITFAQENLPRENRLAHARAYFSLGLAYEIVDRTGQAVAAYLQSAEEAASAGVLFLAIHARCAAAQVQISQGCLHLASQTLHTAVGLANGATLPPLGLAWSILGSIAIEHNDLDAAASQVSKGIALSRQGGLTDDVILGLASLARLRSCQGDSHGALDTIQEIDSLMHAYEVQRLAALVDAYRARMQLHMGQIQVAAQWAARILPLRDAISHEFIHLTLARVLLAAGDLESTSEILHVLLEKAGAAGRMQTCIEAQMLLGLIHNARHDAQTALDWLGKSLRLAAPEGYVRIFLDEGQVLLDLLPKVRSVAPEFVDTLLDAERPRDAQDAAPSASPEQSLLDPLSDQEMRVLQLIMAGLSNREIAEELVISVGTAKWHVHNVLQKLGVGNRAQAIIRAHALGIT